MDVMGLHGCVGFSLVAVHKLLMVVSSLWSTDSRALEFQLL